MNNYRPCLQFNNMPNAINDKTRQMSSQKKMNISTPLSAPMSTTLSSLAQPVRHSHADTKIKIFSTMNDVLHSSSSGCSSCGGGKR
jgi:hypothetical protein